MALKRRMTDVDSQGNGKHVNMEWHSNDKHANDSEWHANDSGVNWLIHELKYFQMAV